MQIPSATYRIQFNPDFGFEAAKNIVFYLEALGISHLYASPIFQPRRGSSHGYDIVDTNQLNPELGTLENFETLISELQQRQMGWLQDIVPNHQAYNSQNRLLMDVLEYGLDSEYFNYFDIEWEHPYADIKGKVLTPLLGDFYGNCLENGEIKLNYDQRGLSVNYYDLKLPIRIESYAPFITHDLHRLITKLGREHPDFIKLLGILYILKNIPLDSPGKQRQEQTDFVKGLLWELYTQNTDIQEFIEENLQIFNGEVGQPESFQRLDSLLDEQFFRLSFWKVGAEELNYRRFFTINELICVRVEDLKVFNHTHDLIRQLVESGKFTGLRVDHIDGLYDPGQYLQRLREKVGDIYITVEKILELGIEYFSKAEELPEEWPVQGTSGYDFLDCLNALFCQREHHRQFTELYHSIIQDEIVYEQVVADKKRLIAEKNLAGDVENLANFLKRLAGKSRNGRDFTLNGLRKAIQEVLILFPVYRTYTNSQGVREKDRNYLQEVLHKAKNQSPFLLNELNFIERILLLEYDEALSEEDKAQWLHFAMKFQQISGPLTAKGVEDTFFYVYNRFISLNEVGSTPHQFGMTIAAFHNFNQRRQDRWPHSMNTTSTHDTKRSEDLRARLNVLSEIPIEWAAKVKTWIEYNKPHKIVVNERVIPDNNDEYFLYQTLVGAFPFYEADYPRFIERIKQYVVKAVREAKVHTAWLRPDTRYEAGFVQFVEKVLQPAEDNQFLVELKMFQKWVAYYGMFNSLSQILLKAAAPGVPDFYQGTELWDLSLVDPDNRRPVDFELRFAYLQEIKHRIQQDILGLITDLMATWEDGKIKLFLILRVLAARNQYLEVFQQGAYIPLEVMGQYRDHIIAFARHYGTTTVLMITPRFLSGLVQPDQNPLGEKIWADTRVEMPDRLPSTWQNAITGVGLTTEDTLAVSQILQHFPVALLIGQKMTQKN